MSRWPIRLRYASQRLPRLWRLLQARWWRKQAIWWHYRHRDYAPGPSMLQLRLTHRCNLRCQQCGQWGARGAFKTPGAVDSHAELSTAECRAVLAAVAAVCPHVNFYGGEPFLRRDLLDLVRAAAALRMVAGVVTNGTLLSGQGRAIVESGLDYLVVSLDGPGPINNSIRRGDGDGFRTVTEGLKELVRAKCEGRSCCPLIELNMTLTELNQRHIVETAALASNLGLDYFQLSLGKFTTPDLAARSRREFKREFGLEPRFYEAFVRDTSGMSPQLIAAQIAEVKAMWGSRYKQIPSQSLRFDLERYFHDPAACINPRPCLDPWLTLQVMPNGDVAFCEDFADLAVGNVKEQHPLELWNAPRSRAWRKRIRTRGIFPAESRCCAYLLP